MYEFTTTNGKKYQLKMIDGDFFYRWYGDGKTPKLLQGGFTDLRLAQAAADQYLREVDSKKATKKIGTPKDILDKLSGKKELLEFASKEGVAIPESFKIPSQIKKYLYTQIGE